MQEQLTAALADLTQDDDYTTAVRDVLRLLGLVRRDGTPTGRTAEMILAVLRAHVTEKVTVQADWNDLDAAGVRGVDVLRWVEDARLRANSKAGPARHADAVGVVIKRGDGHYLMEYDYHGGQYQPFGGKIDPEDETDEDALRRELYEEMALDAVPDEALLSLRPLEGTYAERTLSPTYGIFTSYTFRYYFAERVAFPLGYGAWISREELASGVAADGREVSDIYQKTLGWAALDALPATEIET